MHPEQNIEKDARVQCIRKIQQVNLRDLPGRVAVTCREL